MNAAEILNAAADLIEPDGAWTQNEYTHELYAFCPLGAIAHVMGIGATKASSTPAARVLSAMINPKDECAGRVVSRFNDHLTTTQADVVALLRRAAIRAASCT